MALAKKINGMRMTKNMLSKKSRGKRKREEGRPKGTVLRRKFTETPIGRFLRYECPVEFSVIKMLGNFDEFKPPPAKLIELVCGNSNNVFLNKQRLERYLKEYREVGVFCGRVSAVRSDRDKFYGQMRMQRLTKYIIENGEKIYKFRMS